MNKKANGKYYNAKNLALIQSCKTSEEVENAMNTIGIRNTKLSDYVSVTGKRAKKGMSESQRLEKIKKVACRWLKARDNCIKNFINFNNCRYRMGKKGDYNTIDVVEDLITNIKNRLNEFKKYGINIEASVKEGSSKGTDTSAGSEKYIPAINEKSKSFCKLINKKEFDSVYLEGKTIDEALEILKSCKNLTKPKQKVDKQKEAIKKLKEFIEEGAALGIYHYKTPHSFRNPEEYELPDDFDNCAVRNLLKENSNVLTWLIQYIGDEDAVVAKKKIQQVIADIKRKLEEILPDKGRVIQTEDSTEEPSPRPFKIDFHVKKNEYIDKELRDEANKRAAQQAGQQVEQWSMRLSNCEPYMVTVTIKPKPRSKFELSSYDMEFTSEIEVDNNFVNYVFAFIAMWLDLYRYYRILDKRITYIQNIEKKEYNEVGWYHIYFKLSLDKTLLDLTDDSITLGIRPDVIASFSDGALKKMSHDIKSAFSDLLQLEHPIEVVDDISETMFSKKFSIGKEYQKNGEDVVYKIEKMIRDSFPEFIASDVVIGKATFGEKGKRYYCLLERKFINLSDSVVECVSMEKDTQAERININKSPEGKKLKRRYKLHDDDFEIVRNTITKGNCKRYSHILLKYHLKPILLNNLEGVDSIVVNIPLIDFLKAAKKEDNNKFQSHSLEWLKV